MRWTGKQVAGCGLMTFAWLGMLVAFSVPILVHVRRPQWEVTLILLSLAAGLALLAGAAQTASRTHDYMTTVLLFGERLALLSCFFAAALHGWVLAAVIAGLPATVGLMMFVPWLRVRTVHR